METQEIPTASQTDQTMIGRSYTLFYKHTCQTIHFEKLSLLSQTSINSPENMIFHHFQHLVESYG